MHLLLGLGNPGRRYVNTRHNAGFLVVDRLARRDGATVERKQLGSLAERVQVGGAACIVAKPQSFMNRSGQPAASLRGYYKVEPDDVVVVHDDVDLPFGRIRVKRGGGHGGHNGLRDLIACIGPQFLRVRFGVGRPADGRDTADFVLGMWSADESAVLDDIVDKAADAATLVVREGISLAMNQVNRREPAPKPPSNTQSDGSKQPAEGQASLDRS